MNEIEREQVKRALRLNGDAMVRGVERLTSSEQLHQFVLNYNVNDGYLPIRAVINHRACDKGTALYIYWQFAASSPAPKSATPKYDAAALLREIETRFQDGSYGTAEYHCDPTTEFTAVQLRKLKLEGRDAHLQSVGFKRIEREWLL